MQAARTFKTQNVEWQARLQGIRLASFRSRAFAFLIDAAIIGVVVVAPGLWELVQRGLQPPFTLSFEFGGLGSVAIAIGYFSLSTWLGKGASLGKRSLGIRVVSLIHPSLSLWHCVERALGYAASFLEGGFGFIQYFTHPNHQTVHDRIAETIVVISPTAQGLPKPRAN